MFGCVLINSFLYSLIRFAGKHRATTFDAQSEWTSSAKWNTKNVVYRRRREEPSACNMAQYSLLARRLAGKNVPKLTYFVSSGTLNLNSVSQACNMVSTVIELVRTQRTSNSARYLLPDQLHKRRWWRLYATPKLNPICLRLRTITP